MKCLAKSPDDRYGSAGDLADDLEHFGRGEAIQVRPPHLGQRIWSWARRRPALASRLAALGLFYATFCSVETAKYLVEGTPCDWNFHGKMAVLLAIWVIVSVVCQQFLDSRRWSIPACFVWGTLDSLLLLAALFIADGVASPLIVGYPLLIVGSGLWFRVRFVSFITALSTVSYGILVADFYWRRPWLGDQFDCDFDRHVIYILTLLLLGASVAYLVHRVRILSSFYGRQMP